LFPRFGFATTILRDSISQDWGCARFSLGAIEKSQAIYGPVKVRLKALWSAAIPSPLYGRQSFAVDPQATVGLLKPRYEEVAAKNRRINSGEGIAALQSASRVTQKGNLSPCQSS
jgi:hypothetical protein